MTSPTITLRSGADIPVLGFGTWKLTGDDAYAAVVHALEAGYRHIDTATMYRNEREVGAALHDSGIDRSDVFLTTKLPPERAGREQETLEQSLRALGVDQIDLWLIHWPPDSGSSVDTWREFIAARDEKLVRAIGVSNYSTSEIDELVRATGETPEVDQIRWAPALYDADRVAQLREHGIALEGYSPFRASDLGNDTLEDIAGKHGVSVPQVILRWHVQHDVIVIPKSARRERIEANFDVFGFALSAEDMSRIDALGGDRKGHTPE